MGKISIYGMEASPPTRSCLLTLKALDLPYELIPVNLLVGEQLKPEFVQKNPQHTVPVLEDDEVCIWDSHAIMAYLVSKYAATDALYPKDPVQRAVIDQRLHFDTGALFTVALHPIVKKVLYTDSKIIDRAGIGAIIEAYELLETFLGDNDYVAGPELTIADFSVFTSVCSLMVFLDLDASKYPNTAAWLQRLKELPYHEEANGVGAAHFEALLKSKNFTLET